ncbi:olfactory receptor class A-like protein 4 [Rhinatrema bivittatum]|uniref:olfactory receptor class A-like protein 4 n=1 Tax=Rhinatrema bivittatum TaxID=194408 RepID=UPI001126AEE9|nr:olfactory receptor class A-like protein 4 [Rhinatrema bivittatum]
MAPAAHPVQLISYGVLISLGILGNSAVFASIALTASSNRALALSDMLLLNIALVNLLLTLARGPLLLVSDAGFALSLSDTDCQLLMYSWVWLRSVSVWLTLCLSLYHFIIIRSSQQGMGRLRRQRCLLITVMLVWILNLVYASIAFPYTSSSVENGTQPRLFLLSSTIRPLLSCTWRFPSGFAALLYAAIAVAFHELLPILLMLGANTSSLLTLYKHHRQVCPSMVNSSRVRSEIKAAKTILLLVLFYFFFWLVHVLAVNYLTRQSSSRVSQDMVVVARFTAAGFTGLYPLCVAVAHSRLRKQTKTALQSCCRAAEVQKVFCRST